MAQKDFRDIEPDPTLRRDTTTNLDRPTRGMQPSSMLIGLIVVAGLFAVLLVGSQLMYNRGTTTESTSRPTTTTTAPTSTTTAPAAPAAPPATTAPGTPPATRP